MKAFDKVFPWLGATKSGGDLRRLRFSFSIFSQVGKERIDFPYIFSSAGADTRSNIVVEDIPQGREAVCEFYLFSFLIGTAILGDRDLVNPSFSSCDQRGYLNFHAET